MVIIMQAEIQYHPNLQRNTVSQTIRMIIQDYQSAGLRDTKYKPSICILSVIIIDSHLSGHSS